jgi:hypothetical protein
MPSNETYIQRLLSQSSKSRNLKRPHREESSDNDNYEAAYKEVTSGFRKSSSRAGSSKVSCVTLCFEFGQRLSSFQRVRRKARNLPLGLFQARPRKQEPTAYPQLVPPDHLHP